MKPYGPLHATLRPVPVVVVYILYLLAAWLNAWQVTNVAEGIEAAGLFGARAFAWVALFAAALQGVATMGLFLLPTFVLSARPRSLWATARGWIGAVVVTCAALAVMGFEALHAVIIQVFNSQGSSMVSVEAKELASAQAQITAVSGALARGYNARIAALDTLAADAKSGNDESGRSGCGDICRGYQRKKAAAMENFADLALPIVAPAAASGPRASFTDLQSRLQLLKSQAARHAQFHAATGDTGLPADVSSSIAQLEKDMAAKSKRYGDMLEIDAKSMAVTASIAMFANAFKGDFTGVRPVYVLAVAYAVIPMISLIALSKCLWSVRSYNAAFDPVQELAQQVERERQEAEQLEKLSDAKRRSFKAWLGTQLWGRKGKGELRGPLGGVAPDASPAAPKRPEEGG